MKASLLFERHQLFVTESGKPVEVHMDLYRLEEASTSGATAFRFSWKKVTAHFGALIETPDDGGER